MRKLVKFSAKDDFNRFCQRVQDDLVISVLSEERLTVSVDGLRDEEIEAFEKEYAAKVFDDIQFDIDTPKF